MTLRDQYVEKIARAQQMALEACKTPRSERDYLLICGKVQQLLNDAAEIKKRLQAQQAPEEELPDADEDDLDDARQPAPPRRARPQDDRLAVRRQGHTPRSI